MFLELSFDTETLAADRAVVEARIFVSTFLMLLQVAFDLKSFIAVSTWEWPFS